jgi:hypothetical protein
MESTEAEYNLYKFIPPPLPLISDRNDPVSPRKKPVKKVPVVSPNDPVFVLHEEVLAQQVAQPKSPTSNTRKRWKPLNETLFLESLKESGPKSETPCTCNISSKALLELQRVLPDPGNEIPVVYRDFSDCLFTDPRQLQKYRFVYVRPRPANFRALLKSILDPTLLYFQSHGPTVSSLCAVHSEAHNKRVMMQTASSAVTEFTFDSQFEGGNLDKALWVKESEFNLFLTADTNTRGHTQWFYFAVHNVHKDRTVTFNIMNFTKNGSLFSRGMRPAVFSVQRQKKHGHKWTRGGHDVRYWKNSIPRKGRTQISHYFTLTFTYTFLHDNDTVYFAYSEPYNYTKLRLFLDREKLNCAPGVLWEESVLCKTLGGLDVPLITIREEPSRPKRQITVTARVHPGETVGSFMCEGFLHFAVSKAQEAVSLRRQFDIVVIPMLNPDGVVAGNNRTSLAGVDLNRKWKEPLRDLYPSIAAAKQISSQSSAFIDLHGHSKKECCFMYGNHFPRKNPAYWQVRFMPLLFSKLTDFFSFSNTRFFTEKCHSQSARAVLFTEYGLIHSFTLEASFHGCISGGAKKEFNCNDFRSVGAKLGQALVGLFRNETQLYESRLSYDSINQLSIKFKDELERRHRHERFHIRSAKQMMELNLEPTLDLDKTVAFTLQTTQTEDSSSEEEEESSGSDSEPSFDNLDTEELHSIQTDIRRAVAESQTNLQLPTTPPVEVPRPHDALEHIFERFSTRKGEERKTRQIPNYLSFVDNGKSSYQSQHNHRMWTQRLLSCKRRLQPKREPRMSSSPTPDHPSVGALRQNYGSFETYMANLQKRASVSTKLPPIV